MTPQTEVKSILDNPAVLERAVLYARVSGDDRGKDGRNLNGQLDMGREYATGKGYTIIAELPEDDKGASGAEIDLPQLNRVREMAHKRGFDVLIVRELDRLSRNLAKQLIVEEELRRAGVRVEYILAEYDESPEGRLSKHIRATIAEYEREKTRERTTRGRRNKIKAGKVIVHSKAPYGYKCNEQSELQIVEDEAEIIKLVFCWYTRDGLSIFGIKEKLAEMRVKTPSGTKHWSTATVHRILKNETYAGVWYYGKMAAKNKRNPRENWLAVDVPSIINRATWKIAQTRLDQNKIDGKRNRKYEYLLSGRVTCECGYKMAGKSKKGKLLYYYCPAKWVDYSTKTCSLPQFRADKVDTKVWEWVKEYIEHPELLEAGLKRRQERQEEENRPLRLQLEIAEDRLTKERRKLARWKEMYADDLITKEELTEHKAQCDHIINSLEKERGELLETLEAATLSNEEIQGLIDAASRLKHEAEEVKEGLEIADASFEEKRWFIQRLDVSVRLVIEDGQKIAYARCRIGENEKRLPIVFHNSYIVKLNSSGFVLTARLVIE